MRLPKSLSEKRNPDRIDNLTRNKIPSLVTIWFHIVHGTILQDHDPVTMKLEIREHEFHTHTRVISETLKNGKNEIVGSDTSVFPNSELLTEQRKTCASLRREHVRYHMTRWVLSTVIVMRYLL